MLKQPFYQRVIQPNSIADKILTLEENILFTEDQIKKLLNIPTYISLNSLIDKNINEIAEFTLYDISESFIEYRGIITNDILTEVALDDYKTGKAIKLDKEGKWYMDKTGITLRHAKVIFLTHDLQRQICGNNYINHDPTKVQDKCIEVLLCKPSDLDKWVAISTLRKLTPDELVQYLEWKVQQHIPDCKDKKYLLKRVTAATATNFNFKRLGNYVKLLSK